MVRSGALANVRIPVLRLSEDLRLFQAVVVQNAHIRVDPVRSGTRLAES